MDYIPDSLVIRSNNQLLNLKGFGNPATVTATPLMNIVVADNDAMTNLEGLEFLQKAGLYIDVFGAEQPMGGLTIRHNVSLLNLHGLDGLVGGIVQIEDNDMLQNLEGFGDGFGDLNKAYLNVVSNDALPNLLGLDSLSKINSLNIVENSNLQDLSGLGSLTHVDGGYSYEDEGGVVLTWGLGINRNSKLQNLTGLNNLQTVTGYLSIIENEQLANLSGLDSLQFLYAGLLWIEHNPVLLNLDALSNLKAIKQFFAGSSNGYLASEAIILGNEMLANLDGLHQIDSLSRLWIENNDALVSLSGLDNLRRIGTLEIYENNTLGSLTALQNIEHVEEYLLIRSNYALSSLSGLGNLQYVGGGFSIAYNALTDLEGLENVDSIGEYFHISQNAALTSLIGLGNLRYVGANFLITSNDALTSLTGLDSIQHISGNFWIGYNPNLNLCSTPAICSIIASGHSGFNAYFNAPGCNSVSEIEAACLIPTSEAFSAEPPLQIFPNPTSDFLQLNTDDYEAWLLTITDLRGKILFQRTVSGSQTISLCDWPAGLYTLRAVSGERVFARKFVRQ